MVAVWGFYVECLCLDRTLDVPAAYAILLVGFGLALNVERPLQVLKVEMKATNFQGCRIGAGLRAQG